jgi:hypothetical protein
MEHIDRAQRSTDWVSLLDHCSLTLCLLWLTGILIEQLYPGMMSAVTDLNAILAIMIICIVMRLYRSSAGMVLLSWQRWYAYLFFSADAVLLLRWISLQMQDHLLGLCLGIISILIISLCYYHLYDRRRSDKAM